MFTLTAFLLILTSQFGSSYGTGWGYSAVDGELDPAHWYLQYQTCAGKRQSPVDIEKSYVEYNPVLKELNFINYSTPIPSAKMTNNGHTVMVTIPAGYNLRVTSGSFLTSYRLSQLHFHWSHTNDNGSEHRIFTKSYPLEMHLVHYDEKVTTDQATQESFGLLVISVMFNLSDVANLELTKLITHFYQIADPKIKNETFVYGLNVRNLLPLQIGNYMTYSGSLTTPPCTEAVQWIILPSVVNVQPAQMETFRLLKHVLISGAEEQIEPNDRNVQDISGRKVYLRYDFGGL